MTGQQHIKAHAAAMQPGEKDSHSSRATRLVGCQPDVGDNKLM